MEAGEGFDWALTPVFDGLAGRSYAKTYKNLKDNRAQYQQYKSEIERSKITLKNGQTASQLAQNIQKAANELKKAVKNADSSNLGKNIVGIMNLDVKPHSNAGYLFSLLEELKIEAFDSSTASISKY
ncbi:unnamed protein product [Didymodactylos carnosus]|uniref:Uncharacterized protein n=1 Tax=Didymodactylos carnosus TaxID=1234261 RepID=A0A816AS03_9BILA|nr:unnamed protein product [Didymodactylos carnosus]CAF4475842.1 unnamed protein product [Didymodactylos carnosus]